MHNIEPISRLFGFDRGIPIDRYYIENFLKNNGQYITNEVLEVGDNHYTNKYGENVKVSSVLNFTEGEGVTIVGDLATGKNIPKEQYDCIILTQVINFIFEVKSALRNAYIALKPGGVLLITTAGISQISRYDMDRWGDYWRFTDCSLRKTLSEIVKEDQIEIDTHGNVAVAKAFLDGLALHEISNDVLDYVDEDYQVLLTAKVVKSK